MGQFDEKQLLKDEARKFFTKPFNLDHAKAGAPIALATGEGVEIVKWDRKHAQCLVTVSTQDAAVRCYTADGKQGHGDGKFDLVMLPLGYIEGKPVFTGDEVEVNCLARPDEWKRCKVEPIWAGTWNDDGKWLRWPAPAKVYPETRMTNDELHNAVVSVDTVPMSENYGRHRAIANAALRHAIDAGQVVVMAELLELARELRKREFEQQSMELGKAERLLESLGYRSAGNGEWKCCAAVSDRAARDMAIAEAVQHAAVVAARSGDPEYLYLSLNSLDLAAIIAKVQP